MATAEEMLAQLEADFAGLDEAQSYFKGLIYGPSGVGKTKLAFEIAQRITDPEKLIYYVDSASGFSVLLNHPELRRRTKRAKWSGISQSEAIAEAIEFGAGGFAKVGCLIYDEYSSMQDMDLDVVMRERSAKDRSKSPDEPKLPDFGSVGTRMRRLTDKLVPLDVHLILVAHERQDDMNNGRKKSSAAFLPGFGRKVKERMHLVARCVADDVSVEAGVEYRRYLEVQPTNTVDAKSRIGTFSGPQVDVADVPGAIAEWLTSGGELKSVEESEQLAETNSDSEVYTVDDDMGVDL